MLRPIKIRLTPPGNFTIQIQELRIKIVNNTNGVTSAGFFDYLDDSLPIAGAYDNQGYMQKEEPHIRPLDRVALRRLASFNCGLEQLDSKGHLIFET